MLKIFKKKESDPEEDALFRSLKSDGIPISREYIKKARNNDGETLCSIGAHYYYKENYSKALAWLLKAAAENHSTAQNNVGELYRLGQGVPKHIPTAIEWYTKSVKQGDETASYAQYNFGLICEEEEEYKDIQKAVNWYKISADNELVEGKIALKRLNEQGYYASHDYRNVEKPQIISKPHSNKTQDKAPSSTDDQQQQQVPLAGQSDEHVNKLIEEKMKKLEEAFQLKLNLLQQDKIEKDTLQKNFNNLKQEHAKAENQQKEKDEEIQRLKETLAQYQAGPVDNPDNDICYDSSVEESDHENDINYDTECGGDDSEEDDGDDDDEEKKRKKKKKTDGDDDGQNDINYDSSASDEGGSINNINYDSSASDADNSINDLNYDSSQDENEK